MKLFSSFKDVLTEAVSFDDLQKAIKNIELFTPFVWVGQNLVIWF